VKNAGIGSIRADACPQLAVSLSSLAGVHGLQPMVMSYLLSHVDIGCCPNCDHAAFGRGICFGHRIPLSKAHVFSALIAADDSNAAISGNTSSAIQGRRGSVVVATGSMSLLHFPTFGRSIVPPVRGTSSRRPSMAVRRGDT
jgi:hypothetical protein